MRNPVSIALGLGVVLALSAALTVMAHEGTGEAKIEAEPSSLTAGGSVVLAGSGLEPDSDRVLVLAGEGLTVEFGTVKTDAEGMFSKELMIPGHLPSGNYELRAIGDETLTTPLAVTAAAGGGEASPAENAAGESVVARQRSSVELGAILVVVVLAAGLGGILVWRAERFGGASAG